MSDSVLIQQARKIIEKAKDKKFSLNERKDQSIALAALMLEEANRIQTHAEKKQQDQLAQMMQDPVGKVFTTFMTDQCFRSHRFQRIADQLSYIIHTLGIPHYLSISKKIALGFFAKIGHRLSQFIIPTLIHMIRRETRHVILPGEPKALAAHIQKRKKENVRVNLNHLGEAILGEDEARHRLKIYLDDLANPAIEYISIKISTLYSQINLLDWESTLDILAERLRRLYRCALKHPYQKSNGVHIPKFVNLDMEEYRDLELTVALFCKVLDEPEFYHHQAGIVLQSYIPDSFHIQKQLTQWAMNRLKKGGAPIKIRLVKGANLAMEQVESSLKLWPQAPYTDKVEVDANFKRMMTYGCQPEHIQAVHLGIGSHNLFDIACALILKSENKIKHEINFEMLEGMADHMRRVVQQLAGDMLLYCPAATREEFQNAVAYLVRRLDENTAPENFLRHAFDLKPGTPDWQQQVKLFSDAYDLMPHLSDAPRRTQNRNHEEHCLFSSSFINEADTDWTLSQNREWIRQALERWKTTTHPLIPLMIAGQETVEKENKTGLGQDPSYPDQILYQYALATQEQVDHALEWAKKIEPFWSQSSLKKRVDLLQAIGNELAKHRGDLIASMVADGGKTVTEADGEVSEAIDFARYYAFNLATWHELQDIQWQPKGTILVAPPWNFPCSIPAGGILAALATGNCVIFKPAPETVLVGWTLAKIFWQAGVSKEILQFIACEDEPVGTYLIQDPRVNAIILTGATATAKQFLKLRPGVDLMAETGGKNTFVITAMADRDLAIKDLLQSAFGHAGQKCSACSLAILEAEVYDDPHFKKQLKDAAASLTVGSAWDLKTKINPMIHQPNPTLLRGLTQLEEGEEWLLKPEQDARNPQLWSPGIKWHVKPSSFTFQEELFGPVLGVVRAETVEDAFNLMNQTKYGLTAGIHSLDEREQKEWLTKIEAGNCYINRTITGAIVERQPFGGCKESSFGKGSKAGGPNYLAQFMHAKQIYFPAEQADLPLSIKNLTEIIEKKSLLTDLHDQWKAAVGNYSFYWKEYFSKILDYNLIRGQDNLHQYIPHSSITLRCQKNDSLFDSLCVIAAAIICNAKLEISAEELFLMQTFEELNLHLLFPLKYEPNETFAERILERKIKRIRMLQPPVENIKNSLAQVACHLNIAPVVANGRLELLHLLREISISHDYHRYGNLGARENEKRFSYI